MTGRCCCLERFGAERVGVALEEDGIDVEALERALSAAPVKLVHVIPNFHNPAGCTLSAAKRERLVELAAEHGFWIFEDDPYRELPFDDEPPPTMLSLDAVGPGDPLVLVLEDRQPGRAGGVPRGPRGGDHEARQARERGLHLAEHARRVGGLGALPLGRARREHRLRQGGAARAPRRSGGGPLRAPSRGRVRACPEAATSSG